MRSPCVSSESHRKFKVLLASLGPSPWLSELPHCFTDLSLLCRQVETKEVPGG